MNRSKGDSFKKLPILVVGSLNMDLVVNAQFLPQKGETVFGKKFGTFPGGKGANQAVAAAKLGGDVTMVGCVGKDNFADELLKSLQQVGVVTKYIRKVDTTTGIALITVADDGANSIVVVAGANNDCDAKDVDRALQVMKEPGIMLLQNEVPIATVEHAICSAKSKGWQVIYNPAPACTVDKATLSLVDIITPNETEVAVLTGLIVNTQEDIMKAGQKLLDMGVKKVVVTMGSNGSLYITKEKVQLIPPISVRAVDTTAAGDCYAGAMAVALSEGEAMEDALQFAAVAAGLSVTKEGAQSALPWREQIKGYIQQKGGLL